MVGKTTAQKVDFSTGSPEASPGGAAFTTLLPNAEAASNLLKAMAHEGRLVILCLLAAREMSVTELESALALRQPAVSQQLARLRADNLVDTRREGKMIYYSLASDQARQVVSTLAYLYQG